MTFTDANRDAGKGRSTIDEKSAALLPDPAPVEAAGQTFIADKAMPSMPSASSHAEAGRTLNAGKAVGRLPVSADLIDAIRELQVRRKFWIGTVNKQTNAVKALVRRGLGWRYDEEESDREKVNNRAAQIVAAALAGKPQKPEDEAIFAALAADLAAISAAIEPCATARRGIEKEMRRAVRKLPIYPWAKAVAGLGELGLAVIIAEVGDLSCYPKKGHLWKRLGLAPFEGKAFSTWRREGGLTAEDWTEAGYSPRRRAEIYAVISEPLMKHQIEGAAKSGTEYGRPTGPYGEIYVRRRMHLDAAHPDWTPKHCQMDAMRVMTKRLLRDLWREWREIHG